MTAETRSYYFRWRFCLSSTSSLLKLSTVQTVFFAFYSNHSLSRFLFLILYIITRSRDSSLALKVMEVNKILKYFSCELERMGHYLSFQCEDLTHELRWSPFEFYNGTRLYCNVIIIQDRENFDSLHTRHCHRFSSVRMNTLIQVITFIEGLTFFFQFRMGKPNSSKDICKLNQQYFM